MAEYYVSSTGGTGAGSSGDPWSWDHMAAQTLESEDIVNVLADGTHTATVEVDWNAQNIRNLLLQGPSSASRAVVEWSGADAARMIEPDTHTRFRWLDLDGGGLADYGIYAVAEGTHVLECTVRDCPIRGVYLSNGSSSAFDCLGVNSTFEVRGMAVRCYSRGTDTGFYGYLGVNVCCIAETSTIGFANAMECYGCIAYNCTKGWDISNRSGAMANCLAHSCSVAGFQDTLTAERHHMLRDCYTYNCTASTNLNNENLGESVTDLSADPCKDAANGDFNYNNDPDGGAILRAITRAMPDLASTIVYPFAGGQQAPVDVFGGATSASTSFTPKLTANVSIPA